MNGAPVESRAAAAGGRKRQLAISAAAPLAGRREAGPGKAIAARRAVGCRPQAAGGSNQTSAAARLAGRREAGPGMAMRQGVQRIATPLLPWQNADIGHWFAMTKWGHFCGNSFSLKTYSFWTCWKRSENLPACHCETVRTLSWQSVLPAASFVTKIV